MRTGDVLEVGRSEIEIMRTSTSEVKIEVRAPKSIPIKRRYQY